MLLSLLIIGGTTMLSCWIFDKLDLIDVTRKLVASYKSQFIVMKTKELSDDQKQKMLMMHVRQQMILLGRLIIYLILFVTPFIVYAAFESVSDFLDVQLLFTLIGILATFAGVGAYLLIKRLYVSIYRK